MPFLADAQWWLFWAGALYSVTVVVFFVADADEEPFDWLL
jgi:hypothetical protein